MSTIILGGNMAILLKDRIAELCRLAGISVRQLEKDLGYPDKTVAKMDIHAPSIDRVVEIANYLNVSVDMLVGNRPIQYDPSLIGEFKELHDNPELRTLLKASSNLPKSAIKAMTVLAREMNNDL